MSEEITLVSMKESLEMLQFRLDELKDFIVTPEEVLAEDIKTYKVLSKDFIYESEEVLGNINVYLEKCYIYLEYKKTVDSYLNRNLPEILDERKEV